MSTVGRLQQCLPWALWWSTQVCSLVEK
jgi:hypothetical protein